MKNILIVEDDKLQIDGIVATLKIINPYFNIYTATNSTDATLLYESHTIDLFILDVDLTLADSNNTGIDIGKSLRASKYKLVPIIYITSVPEMIHTAVNDVHCFNYILKPYSAKDIEKAIYDISTSTVTEVNSITIQDLNGVSISLNFDCIAFIHTEKHTQNFYTSEGLFSTRVKSLKDLCQKLPHHFVQIHKSYIINLSHIKSYDKTICKICIGGNILPVGRSYKKDFELLYGKEAANGL